MSTFLCVVLRSDDINDCSSTMKYIFVADSSCTVAISKYRFRYEYQEYLPEYVEHES